MEQHHVLLETPVAVIVARTYAVPLALGCVVALSTAVVMPMQFVVMVASFAVLLALLVTTAAKGV